MKIAMYKMKNNKFLGNCFAFVFSLEETETPKSFTRSEFLMFVKTDNKVWNAIHSQEEWTNEHVFGHKTPMLRIGSECLLGSFGDSHCNCEEERIVAMKMIKGNGAGIYVHLPQEAQGQGLFYKAHELNLQVNGVMPNGMYVGAKTQTEAATILLGRPIIDSRNYDVIAEGLKALGLEGYTYDFMSRNVKKVRTLKTCGISINRMVDITTTIDDENVGETLVKWIQKGFCFTTDEATQIITLLNSGKKLPPRAENLIEEALSLCRNKQSEERLFRKSHLDDVTRESLKKAIFQYVKVQNERIA